MKALVLLCIWLWPLSAGAVEQLVIGRGGISFQIAKEESNRLSVAADSLWIWQAQEGENIAPLVLERGGRIFAIVWRADAQGQLYPALPRAVDIANMIDGDDDADVRFEGSSYHYDTPTANEVGSVAGFADDNDDGL